jgi:hypothetical protein
METANYNELKTGGGSHACTNPGHCNDSYRMVEYLDTILAVTTELRQILQKHISSNNPDYGLIMCMLAQVYDQAYTACYEVQITD